MTVPVGLASTPPAPPEGADGEKHVANRRRFARNQSTSICSMGGAVTASIQPMRSCRSSPSQERGALTACMGCGKIWDTGSHHLDRTLACPDP
jgi:hypothetical protein